MTKQSNKTACNKQGKADLYVFKPIANIRSRGSNGVNQKSTDLKDYKDSPYRGNNPDAYYDTLVGIGRD